MFVYYSHLSKSEVVVLVPSIMNFIVTALRIRAKDQSTNTYKQDIKYNKDGSWTRASVVQVLSNGTVKTILGYDTQEDYWYSNCSTKLPALQEFINNLAKPLQTMSALMPMDIQTPLCNNSTSNKPYKRGFNFKIIGSE